MPGAVRLPLALISAIAAAEGATVLLRPREPVLAPVPVEARAYFSPGEIARARAFRRGQRRIRAASAAADLALLAGAARLAPRALGGAWARGHPVAAGAAAAAGLAEATTLATLPLSAWARRRAMRVGLVTQSWGGWAADTGKGLAISAVFAGAGGATLVALQRRTGRAWWAAGSALGAGFGVAATALAPVLLDPVFNRFTPLPEGPLRHEVLALAARSGVDVGEVYEVDASRRTTGANAYVNGLGRTKRVVLYDTLLRDFTPEEVRLVVAHELAHVRHRDVPRGLAWTALATPLALLAAARLAERLAPAGALGTAAAVPSVALALGVVAPVLGVASTRLSRPVEVRADAFALRLTGETAPLIGFERRITVQNVAEPDPPRWLQRLLGTHPTTLERIGQALAHERAATGSPAAPGAGPPAAA